MRNAILASILLVLLPGLLLAQDVDVDREHSDRIHFYDDDGKVHKQEDVKVTEATFEKVVFEVKGGRAGAPKPGALVIAISYGDAPRVYTEGLQALSRGQYDKAVSDFDGSKNAVDAGLVRPWLLEYASVYKAEAQRLKGEAADAAEEYKKALAANPKSLLFDVIQMGLAECFISEKRWDDATAAAKALADVGKTIKQPVWLTQGEKMLAQVSMAQGDHLGAVTAYKSLEVTAKRELKWAKGEKRLKQLQGVATEAAVEQGWALVARAEVTKQASDWDKAKSYFQTLPGSYPNNEWVSAATLNGVGRCMLDQDPRGALLKFVEAEVVNFGAKKEVARALYLKALAYEKMGGARGKKMAEEARKELREFYPDSEWAKK
ncbi:MAG: tetratricopeptide repeat protein [Planctomycetota bacterium]|jgi:tetratricopeptide (TPR) repeat protein